MGKSKATRVGGGDSNRGLTKQFPIPPHRVVHTTSGMYLAAAYVTDQQAVVDTNLYWGAVASAEEGRYLCAVLNSDAFTLRVRPLQSRGEHNPRDFHKHIWRLPVPLFEPSNDLHQALVQLAGKAQAVASSVALPPGMVFQAHRRRIRAALVEAGVAGELDAAVNTLLA